MRKVYFSLVFMLFLALFLANPVLANTPSVMINGEYQSYDQTPLMENGRVLVPFRGILETLGATIEWHEDTKIIKTQLNDTKVQLQVGSKNAYVNGVKVELDVAPRVTYNYRTVVPLRFISEALGAYVDWHSDSFTALITTDGSTPVLPPALGNEIIWGITPQSTREDLINIEGTYPDSETNSTLYYHTSYWLDGTGSLMYNLENDRFKEFIFIFDGIYYFSKYELEQEFAYNYYELERYFGEADYVDLDWNNGVRYWTISAYWDKADYHVLLLADYNDSTSVSVYVSLK